MATPALSEDAIVTALQTLDGWQRDGEALVLSVKLKTYAAGLLFAGLVGALAEIHDHHPDMQIGYKTVRVRFSTHDADHRISQKDVDIARAISAIGYPTA